MALDKLTDTLIRKAAPGDKSRKLFDGGGLYLEITPTGSKWFRFKYRYGGKERLLSMGTYPETTLKEARLKHEIARKQLAEGQDPSEVRKGQKAALRESVQAKDRQAKGIAAVGSFEAVAREWVDRIHKAKVSVGHAARTLIRFEQDVFPYIGAKPIHEVTAPVLLSVLRRVEARGAIETAHRVKDSCGQVFRYGIASGLCERDWAADLRDALQPVNSKRMAAIIDPIKAGELLRAIHGYTGFAVTRAALRLAPLVFQRPGNLREMEWAELDLDGGMWTIPAAKMKRTRDDKLNGRPHEVPLSTQAVEILRELHALTGHARCVFPGIRGGDRPMSNMTLNAALQRLGYDTKSDHTAHGFRAMARTMLAERLGQPEAVIEAQLAHAVKDALGDAYNRAKYLDQRRVLMQTWADYLDTLRLGAKVVSIKTA